MKRWVRQRASKDVREDSLTVVYHQRKPQAQFSVEEYFSTVRAYLPSDIRWRVAESSRFSRGLWPRVANTIEAARRQGDINHVTGDIHYITLALRPSRTILTVLDCGFETRPPGWRREVLRTLWFSWPERRVARLTAISRFTKDRLVALLGCSPERVEIVPVCLSAGFNPQPRSLSGRPIVLQVGTKSNKNLERLAQALRGLPCDLRVVGRLKPGQRAALAANDVTYSETHDLTREGMIAEYARADIVALASTYEGFGMPILEGQAVGRPVLTSSVASMPEVAGGAAWLVDPYDVDAIRAGLRGLLENGGLRARLVDAGFRNIRRFTPEIVAGQYARLYREIARQGESAGSAGPLADADHVLGPD